MRKILIITFLILTSVFAKAQIGISLGPQLQYGFGSGQLFKSLNLGVEIPRDEDNSIMIRAYGSLRNSFLDSTYAEAAPGVYPSVVMVDMRNGISTFGLEGGMRRYFLGSNFDYGFALYGGSIVSLSIYRMSSKVADPIDESVYTIRDRAQGSVFMLNFGLQGGAKKQFAFGTIFADLSLTYAIIATGSAKFKGGASANKLSMLNFGCVIGYRRDLYFK